MKEVRMWEMVLDAFMWPDLIILGPIFLMLGTIATGSFLQSFLDLVGWWLYVGSLFLGFFLLLNQHYAAGIILLAVTIGFSFARWFREKRDYERLESKLNSSNDWMKDR